MQPVLEFVKRHACSYTYSVRAPGVGEKIPDPCYLDLGHMSLAACLLDAAQALSTDFPRVQACYQGIWMGAVDVRKLGRCAEALAREWMLADERRDAGNADSGRSGMVAAVDFRTTA